MILGRGFWSEICSLKVEVTVAGFSNVGGRAR
jgi:hypothetical protein